jgi:hypothetical protein
MERLDELSKLLAASVSRRESLRSIGLVLAGAALSPLGLGTAWAARPDRCTAFCRWCPTRKKRNQCLAACRACNGNTSRLCGRCGAYACCGAGTTCCGGTCTDLNSDPHNCGACGYVCDEATPVCRSGSCVPCSGGETNCGGYCANLAYDPYNCGACGYVCPGGSGCIDGLCDSGGCPAGLTLCGGECVDLSSAQHCGGCFNACPQGWVCFVGSCCNPTVACCFDPCP